MSLSFGQSIRFIAVHMPIPAHHVVILIGRSIPASAFVCVAWSFPVISVGHPGV